MAPLIDAKQVISKLEQWLNSRAMPAQYCSTKSTNGCSTAALSSPIGDLIGKVCFAGELGGDPIDVGKPMRIRHYARRSGWREASKECAPI